jgi:hypothetical protein
VPVADVEKSRAEALRIFLQPPRYSGMSRDDGILWVLERKAHTDRLDQVTARPLTLLRWVRLDGPQRLLGRAIVS